MTSDPHRWPDSVKTSQQSRNSNDITITSQDTLQSLLARVGLTEHMELFQVCIIIVDNNPSSSVGRTLSRTQSALPCSV